MSNRLKKKEAAAAHNNTMEIVENMLPLGQCDCELNGDMFMYLKSEKDNIWNIYCTQCTEKKDFRKIDEYKNVKLFYPPSDIMNTLVNTYGEDVIVETQELAN